jgi:hypothetical protein
VNTDRYLYVECVLNYDRVELRKNIVADGSSIMKCERKLFFLINFVKKSYFLTKNTV